MRTTATRQQVIEAIIVVNKKQGYQIELNRDEQKGKYFNFTLKSRPGIPGACTSYSGRNLPKASWYAHGYIFDEIFKINPDAIIYSIGRKITIEKGNWKDYQKGSMFNPLYASKLSIR